MNNSIIPHKTYVISIAISEYYHLTELPNAVRDADNIINVLEKDYNVIIYERLHNIDISDRKLIIQSLSKLQKELEPDDALLIIYNGHGEVSKKGNITYWPFRDSTMDNENTWFKCIDLFDEIKKLNIKDVAVFVNACYSGNLFSQDGLMVRHYDEGGKRSRILFTSGVKAEKVNDDNPFSSLMVEALDKYKNNFQVSLRRIIDYVTINSKEEDIYSKPRDDYFREHEGGQFLLLSRNQEYSFWKKAKETNTIESYEQFLEKFPNGEFTTVATEAKEKLVKENDDWLNMLKNILNQISEFQNRDTVSKHIDEKIQQVIKNIDSLRIGVSGNVDDYEEWSKVRAKNNDPDLSNSEKMKALGLFIKQYPKNIYRKDADNRVRRLREKEKDEKAWQDVPKKQGIRNIANRRRGLFEYTQIFYNGKKIDEANNAYKGILLFEKAIEFFGKDDFKKSSELFNRYIREFSKGEYIVTAQQRLKDSDIVRTVQEQGKILQNAIDNDNTSKIYEVIDFIEGFTSQERKAAEEIYNEAKINVKRYEDKRQEEFDTAVMNDKVSSFRYFIQEYEKDELANTLADEMQNKLLDKDTELFNIGEFKTQNIQDFKFYIKELGEEGQSYEPAKERIAELNYFSSLQNISGYEVYLKDYPKGLKREDAAKRIVEMKEYEKRKDRYEDAINSNLSSICKSYLDDYDDFKDSWYGTINNKYTKLKEQEEEQKLYEQISNSNGFERFTLCSKYLAKYKDSYRFENVQELQKVVKAEIDCDTAFDETIQKTTKQGFIDFQEKTKNKEVTYKIEGFNLYLIECFELYKEEFNSGRNHDKVDDYIYFLKAKQSKKRGYFQNYLEKYEYREGLNVERIHDGLSFLDAFEKETIEALAEYLKSSKLQEFQFDANRAIETIEKANKVERAFSYIQNFEGEIDEGIRLCTEFLRDNRDYNKEYDRFVADKKSLLTYERDEDKDYKDAIKDGSEDALFSYLEKHRNKGHNYGNITKLLREKELGVTKKDKDVLSTVKDLAIQMEKSNNSNSQVVTELMQSFSTQIEKAEQNRKKERQITYTILGVIFLIITGIILYTFQIGL
jgi:hypothetical protein